MYYDVTNITAIYLAKLLRISGLIWINKTRIHFGQRFTAEANRTNKTGKYDHQNTVQYSIQITWSKPTVYTKLINASLRSELYRIPWPRKHGDCHFICVPGLIIGKDMTNNVQMPHGSFVVYPIDIYKVTILRYVTSYNNTTSLNNTDDMFWQQWKIQWRQPDVFSIKIKGVIQWNVTTVKFNNVHLVPLLVKYVAMETVNLLYLWTIWRLHNHDFQKLDKISHESKWVVACCTVAQGWLKNTALCHRPICNLWCWRVAWRRPTPHWFHYMTRG